MLKTLTTPGCDGAPWWRIGVRELAKDTKGRRLTQSQRLAFRKALRAFVNQVGPDSACAVRIRAVRVEAVGLRWPAKKDPFQSAAPKGDGNFRKNGNYDSTFYLVPNPDPQAPPYGGITFSRQGRWVESVFLGGVSPSNFIEHEWLHQVVWFYPVRQHWPYDAVHAACRLGYTDGSCAGNERYFADLLQGKVHVAGSTAGILPDEWRYFGTPRHPENGAGTPRFSTEEGDPALQ